MSNIKKLDLPSFEKWYKEYLQHSASFELEFGAYSLAIDATSWGTEHGGRSYQTIKIAVSSAGFNPLNVYAPSYYSNVYRDYFNETELHQWYDAAVAEVQEWWKAHIAETYLEKEGES